MMPKLTRETVAHLATAQRGDGGEATAALLGDRQDRGATVLGVR